MKRMEHTVEGVLTRDRCLGLVVYGVPAAKARAQPRVTRFYAEPNEHLFAQHP